MKKVYEFLVWDNCNNNCQFCWQREKPRIYNVEKRKEILNEVLNFIRSDKFEVGSHILVCGGEIFDDVMPFDFLKDFFFHISCLMYNDVIDLLYLNTNLLTKNIDKVLNILGEFEDKGLLERIRFTTSYDVAGRFRDEESEKLMLQNLDWVRIYYPTMPTVVNMILTKPLCEKLLTEHNFLNDIMSVYKCWVNLIPYIVLDKKLTAPKKMIFQALMQVNEDCPGYLQRYIPNMCILQEKWLYMYKDNEFQFCSCPMSDCGHSVNFKKYSTTNTCFCCDLQEVFGKYV